MSKVVLVGANHAGTACANTLLDNYPEHELVIFDRNNNISYLGCGTALWVGRQIESPDGLFYCSKDVFESKNATVYIETEVTHIDFKAKKITAKNKEGKEIVESYDKLVLATGSLPIQPKLPGINLEGVQSVKLFQDAVAADKRMSDPNIKSVAVVGAGYIGVEIAEAVHRRGKKAYLFDVRDTSLCGYYDAELTHDMDAVLQKNGVNLHLNESVVSIDGDTKVTGITTNKGNYQVDMVVLAIGFNPNTALGRDHLKIFGKNQAYLVDLHQQTSDPDVFAIGDCATVFSNALQDTAYIALATNAVRSGIVAAHNLAGTKIASNGVQGSNGISIFGYNMVSTGLTLRAAKEAGFQAMVTEFEDLQRPAFMKENHPVKIRIVYDGDTRRILGAQMASYEDISMGIHMFSLAIEQKITIDHLKLVDIFFLPHFNQPYNYITMAAITAK
ncbi:H2O-forming NADH oxidase [Entomospira culicis]|uniref:NADH oxidase n=1 Tax=Entomospira culicis TaxID=2719989 RepID=A0A968GGF1_9SPIO|nr:FAD-dependent oxidoreductase [Entomospira culicis]NIZ19497.1 FAD-dependent oxidoreductase [Entomospira culicis]NIZ69598.1 FAD-dependent oxidoreductase [Entomospira culicis]WDI36709.1 FAD-dependent oxidoreductase [Entomospira culicis]WDI38338.1 FAD-dependent oxidoreductase [Entomospira culicis]